MQKSGKFGRPKSVAEELANSLRAEPETDWIQSKGLVAVRCWFTPDQFEILVGEIVYRGEVETV